MIANNRSKKNPDIKLEGQIIIIKYFKIKGESDEILDKLNNEEFKKFEFPNPQKEDVSSLIYTSGTTGRSKGVLLTHGSLSYVAANVLVIQDVNERDIFLSILPLSHVYEHVLVMILSISQGAKIYYLN